MANSGDSTPTVSASLSTPVVGETSTEAVTNTSLPPNTAAVTDPTPLQASIQDFHVQLVTLQKELAEQRARTEALTTIRTSNDARVAQLTRENELYASQVQGLLGSTAENARVVGANLPISRLDMNAAFSPPTVAGPLSNRVLFSTPTYATPPPAVTPGVGASLLPPAPAANHGGRNAAELPLGATMPADFQGLLQQGLRQFTGLPLTPVYRPAFDASVPACL